MIPNPDYGQPPPGGAIYTPEQKADHAQAVKATRLIAALAKVDGTARRCDGDS